MGIAMEGYFIASHIASHEPSRNRRGTVPEPSRHPCKRVQGTLPVPFGWLLVPASTFLSSASHHNLCHINRVSDGKKWKKWKKGQALK